MYPQAYPRARRRALALGGCRVEACSRTDCISAGRAALPARIAWHAEGSRGSALPFFFLMAALVFSLPRSGFFRGRVYVLQSRNVCRGLVRPHSDRTTQTPGQTLAKRSIEPELRPLPPPDNNRTNAGELLAQGPLSGRVRRALDEFLFLRSLPLHA